MLCVGSQFALVELDMIDDPASLLIARLEATKPLRAGRNPVLTSLGAASSMANKANSLSSTRATEHHIRAAVHDQSSPGLSPFRFRQLNWQAAVPAADGDDPLAVPLGESPRRNFHDGKSFVFRRVLPRKPMPAPIWREVQKAAMECASISKGNRKEKPAARKARQRINGARACGCRERKSIPSAPAGEIGTNPQTDLAAALGN